MSRVLFRAPTRPEWVEKGRGNSSRDTHQNFTPAAGGLSVTYGAAAVMTANEKAGTQTMDAGPIRSVVDLRLEQLPAHYAGQTKHA